MKRPTAALAVSVGFVAGLALGGCSKEGESSGSAAAGDGKSVPPALLEKWKKASLTVSAFTDDKSGKIGTLCQSGTVSGVDVVWCAFPAEADAKAAEPKGLEWVGEATGTALVSGKQLLAVVDRRAADPSGRTINAVTKAFR
jgi:hypothetical protein